MSRATTLCGLALCALVSCNRMVTPPARQTLKDADARLASGDYLEAVGLYERALDGSANTAEVHYKLAMLYDDKMNDQLNAMHHFKRYLMLAPSGPHAAEVKKFLKRDELTLATTLSGDTVVTRAEAARLRNDNLSLRQALDERLAQAKALAAAEKTSPRAGKDKTTAKHGGKRSHVVKRGETLFSLSRRYYHSPDRWKDIRDANSGKLEAGGKLKVGQTLIIP